MESDQSFESSMQEGDSLGSPVDGGRTASSFGKRLAGTFRGSRQTFVEIAADRRATWHAVAIILVGGFLPDMFSGVGFWASSSGAPAWGEQALGAATASIFSLILAVIMAFMLRYFAKQIGRPSLAYAGWFRVVGFTSAVYVLGVIPVVGWIAGIIYSLVLYVVATKELASETTSMATLTVLIAHAGVFLVTGVLALIFAALSYIVVGGANPFA